MNWFTQLPIGVQYGMIVSVSIVLLAGMYVFYKSKFKIKSGDKEIDKDAPEEDGDK